MRRSKCEVCENLTPFKCNGCQVPRCDKHRYSYVDGNNGAITRNSPDYCERCYRLRYDPK